MAETPSAEQPRMKAYGFFGWKEFNNQRRAMLNRYFEAKRNAESQPVQTDHGVAAEAFFREFLKGLLPKKFDVTSGYIIPDLLAVSARYELPHFDVIVYDALEAPILWANSHPDNSAQGAKRAIPAKHVRAVLEVKATLTRKHITDARAKLNSLHLLMRDGHFVDPMMTAMIFFELPERHESKNSLLSVFGPTGFMSGHGGAMVLHSPYHPEAVGIICVGPPPKDIPQETINADHPVCKDLDKLNVYAAPDYSSVTMAESGGEIRAVFLDGKWHIGLGYHCAWTNGQIYNCLSWSRNNFALFVHVLLAAIEGRPLYQEDAARESQPKQPADATEGFTYTEGDPSAEKPPIRKPPPRAMFGQVFDAIYPGPEDMKLERRDDEPAKEPSDDPGET